MLKRRLREHIVVRRTGMTMVELLGVMVVLAILSTIAIGGIVAGQNHARNTAAMVALDGYADAFTNVCVGNPGLGTDRLKSWVDESSYTSENGLKKVIAAMNELLDDELMLYWDTELKCYKSLGRDPWGDHYIVTEYPISPDGSVNYFDPTAGGRGFMGFAIWCTGNDESVLKDHIVGKDSKGVILSYIAGIVDKHYQGIENSRFYDGWTVKIQ